MIKLALLTLLTALVIGLVTGPFFIMLLRYLKFGQTIRADGPKTHLKKAGTPTMGGLIFLLAFVIAALIWGNDSRTMMLVIGFVLLFGLIGFLDDGIIIVLKRSLGLTAKQKLVLQFAFAFLFIYLACHVFGRGTDLVFPGGFHWDLGWFYYLLMTVYMVFMVNAVNLTDGLDGLAGGISFLVALGFMIIALLLNRQVGAAGLIDYGDLAIAAGGLAGGLLAFLFFNRNPAKVFMGDTGSLALGGAVMIFAILTKTEVASLFIGIIYLVEALSVVIQVTSFRLTGKRVFKMAPLHHHFEMLGWAEKKVVYTFWVVAAFGVLLGLFLTTI